jgi:endonuclease/exonuclease/phosphatase family metal-dependent hydrolase
MLPVILLVVSSVMVAGGNSSGELPVKAMSFNIRYGTASDGPNRWPQRRELVGDVIRAADADFVGLQEALRFQIDAVREALPQYSAHGVGRDDGRAAGEYSAILYRSSRWQLERGETLWLSDRPHDPGSTSWGNTIPRIVTWGRFVEKKTGRTVVVFNTHFDHRSQISREKSADFIRRLIEQQPAGEPLIVMGDFNAGERNAAIERLKQPRAARSPRLVDTFRVAHPDAKLAGTFNGFQGLTGGEKIDYVFTVPSAKVRAARIIRTQRGGQYPSDHFPVEAEIVFQPSEAPDSSSPAD